MIKMLCAAPAPSGRTQAFEALARACAQLPPALLSHPRAFDHPATCNAYFALCHQLLQLLHGAATTVDPPPLVPASPRSAVCQWLHVQVTCHLPQLRAPCTAAELNAGAAASIGRFLHVLAAALWVKEGVAVGRPVWGEGPGCNDGDVEEVVGGGEGDMMLEVVVGDVEHNGVPAAAAGASASCQPHPLPLPRPVPAPGFPAPPPPRLIQAAALHAQLRHGLNGRVQPKLQQLAAAAQEDLNRVRSREDSLQRQAAAATSRLKAVAQQQQQQQQQLQSARSRVAGQMRDADSLQSKLEAMSNEVARATSALSSQAPLEKLKRAMGQMKQEMRAVDVLVGVNAQLVQQANTRSGGAHLQPTDSSVSNDFDLGFD